MRSLLNKLMDEADALCYENDEEYDERAHPDHKLVLIMMDQHRQNVAP